MSDDSLYTVTHQVIPGDRGEEGWVARYAGKWITWTYDREGAVLGAERHAGHRLPALHDHAEEMHRQWLSQDD